MKIPAFAGGSYVIVQKYLHNLEAWNKIPTEAQEKIIGRSKVSDIELDDSVKPTSAHNALTTIEENGGKSRSCATTCLSAAPASGEFGTYFIGYSRSPRTIELMLENMFVGRPPGNYDRILDFSTPVTGSLFFIPTSTFLDDISPDQPALPAKSAPISSPGEIVAALIGTKDGSLGIGSLKGEDSHE